MRLTRLLSTLAASVAVAGVITTAPAGAVPDQPAAARFRCSPGYFCIYSGWNGGGDRCQWRQAAKANTADDCRFIQRGQKVRSLWNGTGRRKQYYTNTNYRHRVGSTHPGRGGNLQGSYQIRSFRPQ